MTEVIKVSLPPQFHDASDGGSKRLLVVDDEPAALVITSRMLQGAGFETLQAPSAREALRLLEQGDPVVDLVITDVVMPETDGRALGRLIAERYPGLPVIYMSAYAAEDIFHRGSPGPNLPFIRKPFPPELLIELVQRHLVV
jgi:two-component system cell cycle sensor histidine kinase/response regulator CckA